MPLLHDYSMDDSDFHKPNVTEDLEHKLDNKKYHSPSHLTAYLIERPVEPKQHFRLKWEPQTKTKTDLTFQVSFHKTYP